MTNRIKKRRNFLGLKLRDISEEINITESLLSLYEQGKRTPNITTAFRIADALDCCVEDLWEVV